jgi:hypothetical protein
MGSAVTSATYDVTAADTLKIDSLTNSQLWTTRMELPVVA